MCQSHLRRYFVKLSVLWRLLDHKELMNHKPSSFCVFFAERVKVMLLCGSDVLQWLSTPGAWVPQQVSWIFNMYLLYHWWPLPVLVFKIPSWYFDCKCQSLYWCLHNRGTTPGLFHLYNDGMSMEVQTESICEDFGIICVTRDGSNTRKLIFENDFLYEHRVWWSLHYPQYVWIYRLHAVLSVFGGRCSYLWPHVVAWMHLLGKDNFGLGP